MKDTERNEFAQNWFAQCKAQLERCGNDSCVLDKSADWTSVLLTLDQIQDFRDLDGDEAVAGIGT